MSDWKAQKSHSAEEMCDHCQERAVTTCLTCRDLFCMFHARQHRASEESHKLHDLHIPQRNQQQDTVATAELQRQQRRRNPKTIQRSLGFNTQSIKSDGSEDIGPTFKEENTRRHHSDSPGCDSATTDSGYIEVLPEFGLSGGVCDACSRDKAVIKCITCNDLYCQSCISHHYTEPDLAGHQLLNLAQGSYCNISKGQGSLRQIHFTSVRPDSVSLTWPLSKDTGGHKKFKVTWRQGLELRGLVVTSPQIDVTDLHPGENYIFNVAIISEDGDLKPYATGCVDTEVPPPENLKVEVDSMSASLTWTKPAGVGQVSFLVDVFRAGKHLNAVHRDSLQYTITDLQQEECYSVSVATVLNNGTKSKPISKSIRISHNLAELLSSLGLKHLQGGKLTLSSVLEINRSTLSEEAPQSLERQPWTFLRELLMANVNVRHSVEDPVYVEAFKDHIYCELKSVFEVTHPLDLVTALFHCADPFLQQEMVSKMSMCQFAVPLLLPNCDTQQSTLMLWAMRDLIKKFRPHSPVGDRAFVEGRIVEMDIPMVSFVRLGKSSLAKSQTLNKLLSDNQYNNTFVHHAMEFGDVPRKISDGLVELSWYLPCGDAKIDIFIQPVAIANLRGDGMLLETQMSFLSQTSAAVFIFTDDLEENFTVLTGIANKAKLFLITNSQSKNFNPGAVRDTCRRHNIKEANVIIKNRQSDADFMKMLRSLVSEVTHKKWMKIENMAACARQTGIQVDEDSNECVKGRELAENISNAIKEVAQFKREQLPLHGQMWKEISQTEEEMYRMKNLERGQNLKNYRASLQNKIDLLRKKQYQTDISEEIAHFTTGISQSKAVRLYFLKWLKIQLDHICQENLEQQKVFGHRMSQTKETKGLYNQISNCLLGTEHFFRELGQLYECACSLPGNTQAKQQVQHLPPLCAQILLDGFPVELVDGDASNIPIKWISAVFTQLHKRVCSNSRIQVLSVLGLEDTVRSTLLNTMFGAQFDVSIGRCTRGAFMQLIKVSEDFRSELKSDFIMVINTYLRSSELTASELSVGHNKLATLVMGLSDVSIINVGMEKSAEMDILQIVVHAFLRMKEVEKKPNCLFVHHNMSGMSAQVSNMRDGRKKFDEQLNEMVREVTKIENMNSSMTFSNVMEFDPDKDHHYIPGFWLGSSPVAPVNSGYSKAVFKLKKHLIGSLQTSVDTERKDATAFIKSTEGLLNSVKFENFIFNFRNSSVVDAYATLYDKYEKWEWSFCSAMHKWFYDKEAKMSRGKQISKSQVIEILQEAQIALDKEEAKINKNLDQYFSKTGSPYVLVKEYKEEFRSSVKCLRGEMQSFIEDSLKKANTTGKESINKIQIQTMRLKVHDLQKTCQEKREVLSDERLDNEFEKMWESMSGDPDFSPIQDIYQHVLSVLWFHFKTMSGQAKKRLIEANLQISGLEKFTVRKQWLDRQHNPQQIQTVCDTVTEKCRRYVSGKIQSNTSYNDSYIRDLLEIIDKNMDDLRMSEECEVSLKLHVCGHALREFQRVQTQSRHPSDPNQLQRSKLSLKSLFKKEFAHGDRLV